MSLELSVGRQDRLLVGSRLDFEAAAEALFLLTRGSVQSLLNVKEVLVVEKLEVQLRVVVLHVHGGLVTRRAHRESALEHQRHLSRFARASRVLTSDPTTVIPDKKPSIEIDYTRYKSHHPCAVLCSTLICGS